MLSPNCGSRVGFRSSFQIRVRSTKIRYRMAQQDTVPVTPEEIVNFILEEMDAGTCPGYYSNLVPSTFDVYLYGADFDRLRPLEQRIREEATNALTERLSA